MNTQRSTGLVDAVRRVLDPTCEATASLLTPVSLAPNDRLEISMDDDGESFVVQSYCVDETGERDPNRMASWAAAEKWALKVPERRGGIGFGRWVMKATDFTALVIHANWPRERITFERGADVVYDFLLMRFAAQAVNSQRKATFKAVHGALGHNGRGHGIDFLGAGTTLIDVRGGLAGFTGKIAPRGFVDHPTLPLTPYQLCMHHTSVRMDAAAFFAEQGTGKTPPTIRRIMHEAAEKAREDNAMYRAIIVAPKNIRTNWQNEVIRFATTPGKCVVLRGGALNRVKQLVDVMRPDGESQWVIVICSYETVKRSWEALKLVEWDLVVADESHYMKSPTAQRTKIMLQLRDRAQRRMVLTGTPMANSIADLYCQLEFLGKGLSGFSTASAFRQYYLRFAKRRPGDRHSRLIGYQNLPVLQERIARVAFVITKAEALPELPEKTYDLDEAEMTPTQGEFYVKLQAQLVVEIEQLLKDAAAKGTNPTVTTTNVLTKLLRLSQVTAGFVTTDRTHDEDERSSHERVMLFPENPKLERLIEIIKGKGPKEKTIVWCCWVPMLRAISRRLDAEGIKHVMFYGGVKDDERDAAVKAFNEDPDVKAFVGNPAAGGVGLNLPGYVPEWEGTPRDHGCNADHAVFYACNWSYVQRSQAEARNHGKARCRVPVRYTDLVIPGTIDEEIRTRVLAKEATALQIQDLRKIMQQLLHVAPEISD